MAALGSIFTGHFANRNAHIAISILMFQNPLIKRYGHKPIAAKLTGWAPKPAAAHCGLFFLAAAHPA